MKRVIGFLAGGTNVYRTKNYIVKQEMGIEYHGEQNNAVVSHDTFIRRTVKRDREYERAYGGRKYVNGKRLPSSMYTRVYVD